MEDKTVQLVIDDSSVAEKKQHADLALGFVEQHEGYTYTEAEEKALVRKIDLVLMPLVSPVDNQN